MTDEQVEEICRALLQMVSFQNADALEHVLGPCKEPDSLVVGVHRIADALEQIAAALESKR
jgi:hypothetical protein